MRHDKADTMASPVRFLRIRLWRQRHPQTFKTLAILVPLAVLVQALRTLPVSKNLNIAFQPTDESIERHRVPTWFDDAKLGIFIHWGLFSVPAYATTGMDFGDMHDGKGDMSEEQKWKHWFAHNAYAEWYFNTLRIDGSPTQEYHKQTFGGNFQYDDFVPLFNQAVESWDPGKMASLFRHVHAKYVVLTTKHHDGFLMWPSQTFHPQKSKYHSERDIVGELGKAVTSRGMRMAYYYSGGVDWSFNDQLVEGHGDLRVACQQDKTYIDYANAHWRELIDRYDTAVLWNDICYPRGTDVNELFAYFYNKNPAGLVNSRFTQYNADGTVATRYHHDFDTPEYKSFDEIQEKKWESCRGIGHSFGYNREEGPEQYLSVEDLVRSFVDIVSKNGNLLLNVGPMANGTIPPIQEERLRGLGKWLDRNGEAVFNTRPWRRAEGKTDQGIGLRFTKNKDSLFVILMKTPARGELSIRDLKLQAGSKVQLLGNTNTLQWKQKGNDVSIEFVPGGIEDNAPAHAIKITPLPGS